MKNNKVIDALETCKKVLVSEIRKYLEARKSKSVKCTAYLPIYTDDTYNLDGYWSQNTVTRLFIDKKSDVIMVDFEDYDEQFREPLEECFNIGEIAHIIDCLK